MIINHNLNAMNAHRNMAINNTKSGKSMEKLSSGLRINRAGDDAAGLAISEKMRGQIRGLDQASRNAQDGISLIQTAEGALNETHSILQRMRELANQSSNDTNTIDDRTAIKEEMKQLTEEIDRIADTTQFNTQNLVDGTFTGAFQIGANAGQKIDVSISGMGSKELGLVSGVTLSGTVKATGLKDGSYTVAGTTNNRLMDAKGNQVGTINGTNKQIVLSGGATIGLGHAVNTGTSINVEDGKGTIILGKGTDTKLAAGDYKVSGANLLNGDTLVGTIGTGGSSNIITLTGGATVNVANLGLNSGDVKTTKTFTIGSVDVSTASKASGSLDTLDTAIKTVSEQRAKLGALQNRLEHTTANLDNTSENLTAAESRIRDVDMAKEMLEYSKNNILNQAAQSMLAQAKSAPEGVLQLLR